MTQEIKTKTEHKTKIKYIQTENNHSMNKNRNKIHT